MSRVFAASGQVYDRAPVEQATHIAQPQIPYFGAPWFMSPFFEREIEDRLLPFCLEQGISTLIYSPLCRGLLSGKYRGDETFEAGDVRALDPKFKGDRFRAYVACVDRLKTLAGRDGKTVGQLAIRWCLDQPGVSVALCGARRPDQVQANVGAAGWSLSDHDRAEITRVVKEMIVEPIGPEFMGPP